MKGFNNILCAVAPDDANALVIERAVALALSNQARLTVVDVIPKVASVFRLPGFDVTPATVEAGLVAEHLRALQALTEPYRSRVEIELRVFVGSSFLELIRAVLRDGHDLVIKPVESTEFVARLLGSNDMHMLRKCPCPVWITRRDESPAYRSIVAAVDFDPDRAADDDTGLNRQILELAGWLAVSDLAALHVVHVWDAPGESLVRSWSNNSGVHATNYVEGERACHQAGLDLIAQQLRRLLGDSTYDYLAPTFHLRRGAAASVIPRVADEVQADLLVMGTVARTGIAGLIIGNTAEAILEQLACSVLAVKPDGFVSPVQLPD